MKKLITSKLNFSGAEVLSKDELKKIIGGNGSGTGNDCADAYLSVEPDCHAQFPFDEPPNTSNPGMAIMFAQCVSDGFQHILDNGCD